MLDSITDNWIDPDEPDWETEYEERLAYEEFIADLEQCENYMEAT